MDVGGMYGEGNGRIKQRADWIVPESIANASLAPDIDDDDIAEIMSRSHDPFHRAIACAHEAGNHDQRRALAAAFPDLFSAFRIAVAAEREAKAERDRIHRQRQEKLEAAGLKIRPF